MNSFLEVETIFGASEARPGENAIFISINPDLVSDFGHFLNYERRMQEQCGRLGLDYCCFANGKTGLEGERLRRVFENDSGYYSMTRTSATGLEGRIAEEFHQAIVREIAALEAEAGRDYDQVFLFMYCGSSLLASTLCDFQWPSRMRLCVNAFWDFLQRAEHQSYAHVARLKFQDGVRLLAMSELHADGIRGLTGLNFACCANPPPLFGDREAYDIVRAELARHRTGSPPRVLVPGLMTLGKGKELTLELYDRCAEQTGTGPLFLFRDRNKILPGVDNENVETIPGDLTDREIQDLYGSADIALLPYEAPTFSVRTSGALVDCLMFGVVPVVMAGTWLADVCTRLDFGRVVQEGTAAGLLEEVASIQPKVDHERARVLRAAARYLVTHNWGSFMERALGRGAGEARRAESGQAGKKGGLFATANRLHREGRWQEAMQIYAWLAEMADLEIYRWNIARCQAFLDETGSSVARGRDAHAAA